MEKVKAFVLAHFVSWIIEIGILSVIAFVTIGEIKKTNEQTRAMLTSIQQFAGERKEAVGNAIDSLSEQAGNVKVEGKLDAGELATKALDVWRNRTPGNKDD